MTLLELGQLIQQKREQQGISIDEIAARIKVSARTLKAIEEGSIEGLPHAVYSKGFIRSFGAAVGVDPSELTQALNGIFPPEVFDDSAPEPTPLVRSMPSSGAGKRLLAVALLVFIVIGVVAAGWYIVSNYGTAITDTIKKPFSAVSPIHESATITVASASLSALDEQSNSTSASGASSGITPAPLDSSNLATSPSGGVGNSTLNSSIPSPATAGAVVSVEPPAIVAQELTTKPGKNTVLLTTTAQCYLRYNIDTSRSKDITLDAGNTYKLQFDNTMKLVLGNAGGVQVTYNGKDMGVPGQKDKRKVLQFPPAQ